MTKTNEITIQAPLYDTFSVASDLVRWPEWLAHYRYNKFLSKMPWGGIVKMAAVRDGLPTSWVSIFRIVAEDRQIQFEHLRSFLNATRGMKVIWQFDETPSGVHVRIIHEHRLRWPIIGGLVNDWVVGWFFIHNIANKTLAGLKKKMEGPAA
jgi:hypothetical protein